MNFKEKYSIKPYDPKFRDYFNQERTYLQEILSNATNIEHVGSTAVEGLEGKGIVDIYVTIPKECLKNSKEILCEHYLYVKGDSEPIRYFFYKDYKKEDGTIRRIHIHLSYTNSPDFKDHIRFRDILRTHPKVKKKYIEYKRCAFKDAKGEGKRYTLKKGKFIEEMINSNST